MNPELRLENRILETPEIDEKKMIRDIIKIISNKGINGKLEPLTNKQIEFLNKPSDKQIAKRREKERAENKDDLDALHIGDFKIKG
ncbi:MAG: hypothetical protein AAB693_02900 [Patescibacteria group bacterium]